ncbi:MAG: hypothetical protein AUJ04_06645 [Acidobacteria bacterium 13_1_40CM_3_55_6]|nr:MAG: hypothetical protein AUJ04_06645 [Acidobacteria bacterium 13_1_40CM_3_55_6]
MKWATAKEGREQGEEQYLAYNATILSPSACVFEFAGSVVRFADSMIFATSSWGSRPRLYAFTCFAGSILSDGPPFEFVYPRNKSFKTLMMTR